MLSVGATAAEVESVALDVVAPDPTPDVATPEQRPAEVTETARLLKVIADACETPDDDENEEDDDDENDTAADDSDALELNPPGDLFALMSGQRAEPNWLEEGIFERGRYYGLTADAKTGKSILMYWFVGHWVQGRSAFDPARTFDPVKVLYLDAENGDETGEKLRDMGFTPEQLTGGLDRIAYPQFGNNALDTAGSAQLFLDRVAASAPDVVVFDTISRFYGGRENDADTWTAIYRLAVAPLRRLGITVVRLDHVGKNADQGARGSSAKMSDLDAHWMLSAASKGSNDLVLTLDRQRSNAHAKVVRLRRVDGPLGHIRTGGKLAVGATGRELPDDPKVAALVAELDRLNIAAVLSRRVQQSTYIEKSGTVKAGTDVWAAAARFRLDRVDREAE
ncbi:AAA family ATPase [Nocardia aurea]|uniref:AAA family ATPase n=1 Tax=Nocardia aurea TaxID=2144174 RepID=UPI0033A4834B